MPRYIDADKVLTEFPIRRDHYDKKNGNIHFIYGVESVMEYIDTVADEQPAEVKEVKHGIWEHTDGAAKCTSCKRKMNPYVYGYAYCPLCGARMDGARND